MSRWQKFAPLYSRLLTYTKPYRGRLFLGIACGILFGSSNAIVLYVVRTIWARVFEDPGQSHLPWYQIVGLAALAPLAMVVRGVLDFLSDYLMSWVGQRSVLDLRTKIFQHVQSLSMDFFSNTRTGEVISRLTQDVNLVQQAISKVVEDIIKQPFTLLFLIIALLQNDWRLTLAALVLFPLSLVPVLHYGKRVRKASRAQQKIQASVVSVLHEAIVGSRIVKAFSMEEREADDFWKLCRDVFRQKMRVARAKALSSPLIEMVAGLGAALVFVYAYFVELPSSVLVAEAMGLFLMYGPVKKLSAVNMQIQESMSGAERVFALLDRQPTVVEKSGARALPPFQKTIRFDHVSFRYRPVLAADTSENTPVLDNINLEIPAGSLTAIVGASGAGKSTLFNLIPRFYDAAEGAVRLDGVDVRDVTFQSLRRQIGLVTQETFLFNDTVGNNIAYGKPGATREEIVESARRAHAHEFIEALPQQYDTFCGESGIKLSGGQRQRIAIARAILKNPPILLLDEATSALDTESERAVQAALDDLMWGTVKRQLTMIVIAHRLSTVQHADRIVVLDKGRIAEEGTHDQLLQKNGLYKRLHDLQFNA
jgi:subfamily B ATP-binding cassette protein MsbA